MKHQFAKKKEEKMNAREVAQQLAKANLQVILKKPQQEMEIVGFAKVLPLFSGDLVDGIYHQGSGFFILTDDQSLYDEDPYQANVVRPKSSISFGAVFGPIALIRVEESEKKISVIPATPDDIALANAMFRDSSKMSIVSDVCEDEKDRTIYLIADNDPTAYDMRNCGKNKE